MKLLLKGGVTLAKKLKSICGYFKIIDGSHSYWVNSIFVAVEFAIIKVRSSRIDQLVSEKEEVHWQQKGNFKFR